MQVIKRSLDIVPFDKKRIINAINKAFVEVDGLLYETESAEEIANTIETIATNSFEVSNELLSVEQIQDLVENYLMHSYRTDVARAYIRYRYQKEQERILRKDSEARFKQLTNFISGNDKESQTENSNKDTRVASTMRDYIAGFACKEMASKFLIPPRLMNAHKDGLIHIHDMDYSPLMPIHNCGLINLEDMLQNNTVISGVLIETPHTFRTACTVVTQIITQVASNQYGGNTINLAHISPFIECSRQRYIERFGGLDLPKEEIERLVNQFLKEEISDGVQTIQYQLITMSTTNGQAPFTSVFMWLNDVPDGQPRADLAMLIEEVLRQRIKGVKNEQGEPITTAFPKLLYTLDENNIHPDSEYWYLTELAAECSAKRLVPDYISAKKMRELKNGQVFGCINLLCLIAVMLLEKLV